MVARGYSSESFAYEAAANIREIGKPRIVYYLGDLDPSGWDMSRGFGNQASRIRRRHPFQAPGGEPAADSRMGFAVPSVQAHGHPMQGFFQQFSIGTESVELDTVQPDMLRTLVRDAIEQPLSRGCSTPSSGKKHSHARYSAKFRSNWDGTVHQQHGEFWIPRNLPASATSSPSTATLQRNRERRPGDHRLASARGRRCAWAGARSPRRSAGGSSVDRCVCGCVCAWACAAHADVYVVRMCCAQVVEWARVREYGGQSLGPPASEPVAHCNFAKRGHFQEVAC